MIGLNPSTADDQLDDPTNRRLIGLLDAESFKGYWLVNLIPESTPYPKELGTDAASVSEKSGGHPANSDESRCGYSCLGAGAGRCPFRRWLVAASSTHYASSHAAGEPAPAVPPNGYLSENYRVEIISRSVSFLKRSAWTPGIISDANPIPHSVFLRREFVAP